jgi:glycosyltransferase involved in cell wall biosynthesis
MIPVVHLITGLGVGGAEGMLLRLLERGDRARFPARVVCLAAAGPMAPRIAAAGVEVTALGMRPGLPDPRRLMRLRALLRRWCPALLQTWLYHADLVGLLAGRAAGVPRVLWNLRCSALDRASLGAGTRLARRACARLSRRPDAVIANSEAGRAFHASIGYRPRRWACIPNGFDLEALRPDPEAGPWLRRELGLPAEALLAGCVARLDPNKDHATLLDALARLGTGPAARLHLVLVGSGVDASPGIRARIAAAGLGARCHLLGERADVARLAAAFDLLVSSSRHEGFPNSIGEAMSCGTPCVVTDAGDSATLVGDTGFVVPVGAADELAAALARMVQLSGPQRRDLGLAARRRVAERYELSAMVRRYENLYEELAADLPACAA